MHMSEDKEDEKRTYGTADSAPVTRGNPRKETHPGTSARRGTEEFDELVEDLEAEYGAAEEEGIAWYTYRNDTITFEKAVEIIDEILDNVVEIDWPNGKHPNFRLKGEDLWRSVFDRKDFPQPDDEADDEEDEEEVEDCDKCFEDCSCPVGACECDPCGCRGGCSCCHECGGNPD